MPLGPPDLEASRENRSVLSDVDAGEDLGRLRDAGQTLCQGLRRKVIQVQKDVVLPSGGSGAKQKQEEERRGEVAIRSDGEEVREKDA